MKVEFFINQILKDANNLDRETRDHITHLIDLLKAYGAEIRMPYSKPIGGGIFELRAVGKTNVRLLYCFHNDSAIILHLIVKKQNKLTNLDIALVRRRKETLA